MVSEIRHSNRLLRILYVVISPIQIFLFMNKIYLDVINFDRITV